MGKRGPRPTPTRLLQHLGSWRGNINRDEPVVEPARPDRPDWLDEDAKEMWDSLVGMLMPMYMLTKLDSNALGRYCHLWSRWLKAEKFLQKYGESYPLKDDKGNVRCFMAWPQASTASKLQRELCRLEQEFGLTPSARSRLNVRYLTPMDLSREAAVRDFFDGGGPAPPRQPPTPPPALPRRSLREPVRRTPPPFEEKSLIE